MKYENRVRGLMAVGRNNLLKLETIYICAYER